MNFLNRMGPDGTGGLMLMTKPRFYINKMFIILTLLNNQYILLDNYATSIKHWR